MAAPSKEQTLLADLNSEKRTIRISAIVQLSKISADRQILARLQQLTQDKDREIVLFANQAVARIKARLGEKSSEPLSISTVRLDHFISPLAEEIPILLEYVRQHSQTLPDDWRPSVADFLAKSGATADIDFIGEWLETSHSMIVLSYIEAVEALDRKRLVPFLPKLLASEHPLVRVKAIQVLQRIDPEEAIAHLSELLGSRKAEDRIAGLSIAFVFPFDQVKPFIFTMLREEPDCDVFQAISTLLSSNPDVETAYKLLDLMDVAPKELHSLFQDLFKSVCEAISLAQLLPADAARPEALTLTWKKERFKKFLADLEIQLTVCDKAKRDSIESWLAKNQQNRDVAAFIQKLGQNPATEDMFNRLTGKIVPPPPAPLDLQNPEQKTPDEKIALLETLDAAAFKTCGTWVRREAIDGPVSVRIAAFGALLRHSTDTADLDLAVQSLENPAPLLILSAVRLMEKLELPRLIPLLPQLLQCSDPAVRVKAIRLALRFNKDKALETISAMLGSPESGIRAQAVSCLMFCPFDRIFETIISALAKESHPDIARQMLLVLMSNPGSQVLDALDQIQTSTNPGIAILVAQTRMDLFDLMLKLGIDAAAPPPPHRSATAAPEKKAGSTQPAPAAKPAPPTGGKASSTSPGATPATASPPTPSSSPPPTVPPPESSSAASMKSKTPPAESSAAGFSGPAKTAAGWAPKPYAVSEVRQAIRKREAAASKNSAATAPTTVATVASSDYKWLLIVGALAAGIAGLAIFAPRDESAKPDPRTKTTTTDFRSLELPLGVQEGFKMGVRCKLEGKLEQFNPDGSIRVSGDGLMFWVKFTASLPASLRGSETIEIELLPYKRLKNGDILSDGVSIREK